jgi:hypothetical protein
MNVDDLQKLLEPVTGFVSGQAVDAALADKLERRFPPGGETFDAIEAACHAAIADGWMCTQGAAGRRFGRVIEASEATGRLSVDVVDLENIVGPHHRHPNGEICMVMPVTEGARFDGNARGWCVFEPGSDHRPTVIDGEALVLYMLPDGSIEFTGQ